MNCPIWIFLPCPLARKTINSRTFPLELGAIYLRSSKVASTKHQPNRSLLGYCCDKLPGGVSFFYVFEQRPFFHVKGRNAVRMFSCLFLCFFAPRGFIFRWLSISKLKQTSHGSPTVTYHEPWRKVSFCRKVILCRMSRFLMEMSAKRWRCWTCSRARKASCSRSQEPSRLAVLRFVL